MFEINVPTKGEIYLKKRFEQLQEELDTTTDPGDLKSHYRTYLQQLTDRIKNTYNSEFWGEIEWIWNHLNLLNLVEAWISDYENPIDKPIYKGFSEIAGQFRIYVNVHSPINEINFPVEVYETLYSEIFKEKGKTIETSLFGPTETITFDHQRVIKTLKKIHRISLTTYKERVYFEALNEVIDYNPKKPAPDNTLKEIERLFHKLKKDPEYQWESGRPYMKRLKQKIGEILGYRPATIQKKLSKLGLTDDRYK